METKTDIEIAAERAKKARRAVTVIRKRYVNNAYHDMRMAAEKAATAALNLRLAEGEAPMLALSQARQSALDAWRLALRIGGQESYCIVVPKEVALLCAELRVNPMTGKEIR